MDYPVFSIREIAEVKSKSKELEKLFDDVVKCTPQYIQDLPYDLRTTDVSKLQERYDAITTQIEEKSQELEDAFSDIDAYEGFVKSLIGSVSNFADNLGESLGNVENRDFDISKYDLSLTQEQMTELNKELAKIDYNLPTVSEIYKKISPKLKSFLKDPSKDIGISDDDLDTLEEKSSYMDNGANRLVRLYDFGEQGNKDAQKLQDDVNTIYSSSKYIKPGIKSIKENQSVVQSSYDVQEQLVNELNVLKKEQDRTQAKIEENS